MSGKGSVGSRVSPDLIKQIDQRKDAFRAKVKTKDQLAFINQNTAWVKLRSSVNEVDEQEFKNLDQATIDKKISYKLKHNSFVAQSFVLQGGTRSTSNESPYGRERAGINRTGNEVNISKAYQNFTGEYGLGYRPMSGITGLQVKSKNTYGTLMEAVVEIKVYSREELDAIELLYFRPGYTALLEWGHSIYLDNSGNVVHTKTTGLTDKEFFSQSDQTTIDEKILEKRESCDGNYDGIYGYITNFSFEYQDDGSYDCTVKIVSKGVILEGLQPSKTSDYIEDSDEENEETMSKDKSAYHFLFHYMALGADRGKSDIVSLLEKNKVCKKAAGNLAQHIKNSKINYFDKGKLVKEESFDIPVYTTFMEMDVEGKWFDKEFYLQFMHLGDWLRLFNSLNILTNPENSYTDRKNDYIFDVSPGNKYTTHPDHYSIDPIVAYPTAKPKGKNGTGENIKEKWYNSSVIDNKIMKECIAFYDGPAFSNTDLHKEWGSVVDGKKSKYGGKNDVLSIPISTYIVEQELDALIESSNSNISLYNVLDNVLDRVSGALAGIVDLDLFYNYDLGRYQVIDRNHRIPSGLPVINLTGLGTTATNLNVSSTISSAVATQVAIAAQGNSGNSKDNLAVMMEWNRGAIDRHIPIKSSGNTKTDEDLIKRRRKHFKNLRKLYYQFQNRGLFRDHKYNPELVANIQLEGATHNAELLNIHRLSAGSPEPATGIVPVELSFDILGIYGFVIGTAFKVNKGFLPAKYDNWAYIITGLEHKIDNNRWITSVKTQFFPDRSPQSAQSSSRPSSIQASDDLAENLAVSEEELKEAVLNDPAPVINSGKIGATGYSKSSVWRDVYRQGYVNGHLDIKDPKALVFIGETQGANRLYPNPANGNKPEYMLHPAAANAWFKWRSEMQSKGVKYSVSSAYRSQQHQSGIGGGNTVATPGRSPHGVGGAIDFRNLYRLVGGSGNPDVNLTKGRLTEDYKQLAEIGAKYGWYNPWRLSDVRGTDECWHFEYWGSV